VARYSAILTHPADHLVHALKYDGWQELAGFMGREIAKCLRDETSQAASLAESVGAVLHLPVRDVVGRALGASSQTALTSEQRRETWPGG